MSARDEAIAAAAAAYGEGGYGHAHRMGKAIAAYEATLTAAGYAVEQGWQPIETAPSDGTTILLHIDWERLSLIGYWNGTAWAVKWDGCALGGGFEPVTHWRPLPAPPAGEATP